MKRRGRPRTHKPSIPAHIDQAKIPAGLLWDASGKGRWYVREADPEGRFRTKTVAQPDARLSELHAIMEERRGGPAKGSVAFVLDAFHASLEFKALAPSTRAHYADYAKAIKAYPTRMGALGTLAVDRLSQPVIRALIHTIAAGKPATRPGEKAVPGYPSKANHWLRYLRRAFGVGINIGACKTNPARGVNCVKEVRDHRMPSREAMRAVQEFARAAGAKGPREKGAFPAYLWAGIELGYQARLRGIEVLTLHDGLIAGLIEAEDARLQTNRRKGSKDNAVRVGARMREAITTLQAYRKTIWERRKLATPIRPEDRPLFVSEDGTRLTRSGWNTAWGRMMRKAVEEGVITKAQRFALHGLKHRGVTDTTGTPDVKKEASGHVTDSMGALYNHDIPAVEPADDPAPGLQPGRNS